MLLILKYLPWFALGVAVHAEVEAATSGRRRTGARTSALLALGVLAFTESFFMAGLAIALLAVLYAAASGRLAFLAWRPLTWLGAISYTLYLLHEYIGWSFLLFFARHGLELNVAIALTLALVLLMAHGVTRTVEQPAMAWIRRAWKQRQAAARAQAAIENYQIHDNQYGTRALSDQQLDRRIGTWPRWTKLHASGCALVG
jgi:peptidoglycan/LPS O-acetylase OafA/YrhL